MARERRARHSDLLSRLGLVLAGLVAGSALLAACDRSTLGDDLATEVEFRFEGRTATWTVAPWPLDGTQAHVCADHPGSAFTSSEPSLLPEAGCIAADVTSNGSILVVRLDPASLDPAAAARLAETPGATWLALAGERAGLTATAVVQVVDSPLFSPPGPS